jgi:hypothetical protein
VVCTFNLSTADLKQPNPQLRQVIRIHIVVVQKHKSIQHQHPKVGCVLASGHHELSSSTQPFFFHRGLQCLYTLHRPNTSTLSVAWHDDPDSQATCLPTPFLLPNDFSMKTDVNKLAALASSQSRAACKHMQGPYKLSFGNRPDARDLHITASSSSHWLQLGSHMNKSVCIRHTQQQLA